MGIEGGRVVEGIKVWEVNIVWEWKVGFCCFLVCLLFVVVCVIDIWFVVCFGNWFVFNCFFVLDFIMLDIVFF